MINEALYGLSPLPHYTIHLLTVHVKDEIQMKLSEEIVYER